MTGACRRALVESGGPAKARGERRVRYVLIGGATAAAWLALNEGLCSRYHRTDLRRSCRLPPTTWRRRRRRRLHP
eukprot:scaffold20044_cov101-Isochrysis_galbana.AAC.1